MRKNYLLLFIILFSFISLSHKESLAADYDYNLLCRQAHAFIDYKFNPNIPGAGVVTCGQKCYVWQGGELKFSSDLCAPFSEEEVKQLCEYDKLLDCTNPQPNIINEVYNLICSKNDFAASVMCAYYKDPNDENAKKILSSTLSPWAIRYAGPGTAISLQTSYQGGKGANLDCVIGLPRLNFWSILSSPFNWLIGSVITAITAVLKLLLWLVIGAFNWFLTPTNFGGYVNFVQKTGLWSLVRDFGNIGLILASVFMAVATILGIKEYNWEKLLLKIVGVALLINFSLVICGMFVDLSNFLTTYFLTLGGGMRLWEMISQIITKISCAFSASKANWNFAMGATVGLLLTGTFLFQFFGLLLFVVTRVVILWLTLITSPLAFVAFVFPGKGKENAMWSTWKNYFIQAIVSLPVIAFTLYFIVLILDRLSLSLRDQLNEANFIVLLSYAILTVVLVQAVRVVAKSLGVEQIEKGYAIVKKAVSQAGLAAGAAIGGLAIGAIAGSEGFRKIGQGLTQVPILNPLGYKMLDKSDEARFTNIRKSEEKMKNRTKSEVMDIAEGVMPSRLNKVAYADYMGALITATKKGWIKHDSKAIDNIKKAIEEKNPDINLYMKDIQKSFPQHFAIKDGQLQILDTKAPDYQEQVLSNLRDLGPEDMPKHSEEIIKTIQKAGGSVEKFLQQLVYLKVGQFRAFIDNISEEEFNIGKDIFGGSPQSPKPWGGPNGELIKTIQKDPQAYQELQDKLKASLALRESLGLPI